MPGLCCSVSEWPVSYMTASRDPPGRGNGKWAEESEESGTERSKNRKGKNKEIRRPTKRFVGVKANAVGGCHKTISRLAHFSTTYKKKMK